MVRVAVCDDECYILKELAAQIEAAFLKAAFPVQMRSFDKIDDLWRSWEGEAFEVLFLDIDMPKMDGVAFGQFLRSRNLRPCIVYVSNRSDRVFETFSVAPLRFVRKSHFAREIDETVGAIVRWWDERRQRQLVLPSRDSIISLAVDDIAYVECFAKVQNIVTPDETYQVKRTLSELEGKLLDFGFLRPHKGYLVNYRHISRIETDCLLLRGGAKIPVSKHKIKETKQEYLRLTTRALSVRAQRLQAAERSGGPAALDAAHAGAPAGAPAAAREQEARIDEV